MVFGFLLIGMLVGTGAAGITLVNGGGFFAALLAYGAAGAMALLLPLLVMLLLGDASRRADIAEGHGASA